MRGRIRVAGLLAAAMALAPMTGAQAQEELVVGGRTDVGLAGGLSISHDTSHHLGTVTGFELLPHVGYVLADAMGPGWLRGNLEVLLEPTLVYFDAKDGSATVGGASANVRWIFSGGGRFRPYLEAGAGVLLGEMRFRQTDCDVNYLLQGGPGLLVTLSERTALTVGYRFQHVSNADSCHFNVGINSSAFVVGVSYFFH